GPNLQNSAQLRISLPNNNNNATVVASSMQSPQVSTVTMSGMPAGAGGGTGLQQPRPVCVITDPNSGTALPPPLHQASQSQAQVNVASFAAANLPPKKIRFA